MQQLLICASTHLSICWGKRPRSHCQNVIFHFCSSKQYLSTSISKDNTIRYGQPRFEPIPTPSTWSLTLCKYEGGKPRRFGHM